MRHYEENPALKRVIDQIGNGHFSPDDPGRFRPIVDSLLKQDTYLLLADFADYAATQARVDALYVRPDAWNRRAALNVAGMGPFSSDRTIREYAERIWHVKPLSV
jgi:starch phosphorylase